MPPTRKDSSSCPLICAIFVIFSFIGFSAGSGRQKRSSATELGKAEGPIDRSSPSPRVHGFGSARFPKSRLSGMGREGGFKVSK